MIRGVDSGGEQSDRRTEWREREGVALGWVDCEGKWKRLFRRINYKMFHST